MTPHNPTRLLLAAILLAANPASSQQDPAIPPMVPPHRRSPSRVANAPANLDVVVLDPAHGGSDPGARLGPNLLEKDITLAFANRLRTLLTARGFIVISTRQTDADNASTDERVDLANRSHPLACLLLHASSTGHGIHLYASSLTPQAPRANAAETPGNASIASWDSVQSAALPQSLRLSTDLDNAFHPLRLPLVIGRVSPAPIDALASPAVAIELAPYTASADSPGQTLPSDDAYQQHVAESIANALTLFRTQMQPAVASAPVPVPPRAKAPRKPTPATP